MNTDRYNLVRLALDRALLVFKDAGLEISPDDREFFRQLELLRSYALKAESGHPFPYHQSVPTVSRPAEATSPPGAAEAAAISCEDPPRKTKRITVVIADDQDTVRELLQAVLAAEGDFEVVAEAANGREAVAKIGTCQPDLIIMDLNMPVLDGISATRESLHVSPKSRVLVFTANRDPAIVQRAMEAGAVGFLFKPAPRRVLVEALRTVHRGEAVIPEGIFIVPRRV